MKRLFNRLLRLDYRVYICVVLFILSGLYGCFFCYYSYHRMTSAVIGLCESVVFYISKMLMFESPLSLSVSEIPNVEIWTFLPITAEDFLEKMSNYWPTFFSGDSFSNYLTVIANSLRIGLMVLMMVGVPLVLLLYLFYVIQVDSRNTKHFRESRPLRIGRWCHRHVQRPMHGWLVSFYGYFCDLWYGWFKTLFLVLWIFNLNISTFVFEFLSWYFYFAATFEVSTLYAQLYRIVLDILVAWNSAPFFVWIGIALWVFLKIRRAIALRILKGHETHNEEFLEEQPLVLMNVGTMNAKKTTTLVDMALTQESLFRKRALQGLREADMKFPEFPWLQLEIELRRAVEHDQINTLFSVRAWIRKKAARFAKNPDRRRIFGYDWEFYGRSYNSALKIEDIWDVLETYSLLFSIYCMKTALCFSNVSIRYDGELKDLGNFPEWHHDFFESLPEDQEEKSHYAHIIDFDALRLGKRMNSSVKKAYEIGCILISEVDKDRKNSLELNDVKRNSEEANQKNDLFNAMLKMIRHPSTVDYYPFARVITDGQRPESWGADARELCNIIHIVNAKEKRLALPGYFFEGFLHDLIYPCFVKAYQRFRVNRGDNTFFMWAFKGLANLLHRHDVRVWNRYGYCKAHIQVESGRLDGSVEDRVYYLANKKIYADRFSTDCYSSFFQHRAEECDESLDDSPTYAASCATLEELKRQNSYFVADLMKIEEESEAKKNAKGKDVSTAAKR